MKALLTSFCSLEKPLVKSTLHPCYFVTKMLLENTNLIATVAAFTYVCVLHSSSMLFVRQKFS
jgi:hypothetical protein